MKAVCHRCLKDLKHDVPDDAQHITCVECNTLRPREADIAFHKLDDAGKMIKLQHHLSGQWPVPADWVRWLMEKNAETVENLNSSLEEAWRNVGDE